MSGASGMHEKKCTDLPVSWNVADLRNTESTASQLFVSFPGYILASVVPDHLCRFRQINPCSLPL